MNDQVLRDLDQFQSALQTHPRVLLFKHSPVCPISAAARAQFELFKVEHDDVPTLFVNVIADRQLARAIADECGVRHESPQVILFEAGQATWNASHEAITAESLAAAWAPRC
ncbi:MAG TPA: bacillithiol system redox-active protein YtxJ [bacterium]|nr:bacillithiol system redox-active protein YtxJ [bacterium]